MLGKVGVGPASMVVATPTPFSAVSLAQDAPQAHANPAIQGCEGTWATVFEVLEPTSQRAIDVSDACFEASPIGASGLDPHRLLQLLPTLLARPSLPALEVIAQEVESSRLADIDDASLVRMQCQSRLRSPLLHPFKRPLGFCLASTHDDEVIRIPNHLIPFLAHEVVQGIQVDVRQQRAEDSSNTVGNFEFEVRLRYRRGERVRREG